MDAGVHGNAMGGAHRTDFFFLQSAQQLGLQVQGQFSDFIEEHRTAFSCCQQTVFRAVGAGECTLHVAEQLAFDQGRH